MFGNDRTFSFQDEKYIFVAAASWRNSKRPKSIIKSFLESGIENSRLVIVGKYKKKKDYSSENGQW